MQYDGRLCFHGCLLTPLPPDWLRRGRYASCGFPQEDFLVLASILFYDSSRSAGLRVGETAGGYSAPEGGGGTAQVAVTKGRRVT